MVINKITEMETEELRVLLHFKKSDSQIKSSELLQIADMVIIYPSNCRDSIDQTT